MTLAQALTALDDMYDGSSFWTRDEAIFALREALRIWNLLTTTWRTRETFSVAAGARWISLPAPLSYGARAEHGSVPLHQGSLFGLDQGKSEWEVEDTSSTGAPTAPSVWAPAGTKQIAIWPARASGSGTLLVDGMRATPVPVNDADVIQLGEPEMQACLGYALHYLAFKEGGARWTALRSLLQNFYRAAAAKNDRLLRSAFFRRMMGLDLDKYARPIRSAGGEEVARGR